jgi:hypothetical protein
MMLIKANIEAAVYKQAAEVSIKMGAWHLPFRPSIRHTLRPPQVGGRSSWASADDTGVSAAAAVEAPWQTDLLALFTTWPEIRWASAPAQAVNKDVMSSSVLWSTLSSLVMVCGMPSLTWI